MPSSISFSFVLYFVLSLCLSTSLSVSLSLSLSIYLSIYLSLAHLLALSLSLFFSSLSLFSAGPFSKQNVKKKNVLLFAFRASSVAFNLVNYSCSIIPHLSSSSFAPAISFHLTLRCLVIAKDCACRLTRPIFLVERPLHTVLIV